MVQVYCRLVALPDPSSAPAPWLAASESEQAAHLRRLVQIDGLTGVALRPRFLRQLQQRLDDPAGRRAALLLVRLPELDILNRRCGRDSTDRLLQAVAAVLLTYEDRVPGSFAGRLNGSEFALCLPVCGVARETAASLYEALATLPGVRNTGATLLIGGIDGLPPAGTGAALAAAEATLASSG